ncbi:MAG: hypothetical protein SOT69_10815 [Mesosutterella sp.]|nr:hypothetical protein [Mesosutterella sp.]
MRQRDPFSAPDKEATDRAFREFINVQRARELVDALMSTPQGRETVSLFLDLTQCNTSSFSTNALQMAWNEGRRSVGISLSNFITPEAYWLMVKESNDRRKQRG